MAASVVVFTHVQPHVGSTELLSLQSLAGQIALGVFVFTLIAGFTAKIIWRIKRRVGKESGGLTVGPLPWYLKMCQVLMPVAFLEMILAHSFIGIKLEADKWMVGGGRGQPWEEISQSEAIAYLWGNLRTYAALLLFTSLMWTIFVSVLIRSGGKNRQP